MVINDISPRYRALIDKLKHNEKIRVLFICLGNICRSPAAEALMQKVVDEHKNGARWTVDSAGLGDWHVGDQPDPRMRAHARQRDLQLNHVCRQIRESDFDDFDLIIGMDASNISRLSDLAPTVGAKNKIMPMAEFFGDYSRFDHVPDPYYDGAQGFETVLDILTDATRNLYDTLSDR